MALTDNILAPNDEAKAAQIKMMLAQSGAGSGLGTPFAGMPVSGLPQVPRSSSMFDPNFLASLKPQAMPAPEPSLAMAPPPPRMDPIQTGAAFDGGESFKAALGKMAGKKTDVDKSNLDRINDALAASRNAMAALYGLPTPGSQNMPNQSDGVTVKPDGSLDNYRYNLGNIRASDIDWQGKTTPFKGFESFATPEAGAMAMYKNLSSYARANPNMTLAGAISKWAPPNENNTANYIKFVAEKAGLDSETLLSDILKDPQSAAAMMYWMGTMEHGQNLPKVFTPEFLAGVIAPKA